MWQCLNCGGANNKDDICSHCNDGRWRCPNCGAENSDVRRNCMNCATRKDGTPPTAGDIEAVEILKGVDVERARNKSVPEIHSALEKLKEYYGDKLKFAERSYKNDQLVKQAKLKKMVFASDDPRIIDELKRLLNKSSECAVLVFRDDPEKYEVFYEPKSCFIATAAYGSPFAPEVMIFRNFRDDVLLRSRFGSMLVEFYYHLSPPLASLIARTEFLRAVVRYIVLAPILRLLKAMSKI